MGVPPTNAHVFAEALGLRANRTLIMGVLNVTPDSFSDGGVHATVDAAVDGARRMIEDGADILDIGGESTRPATFHDNKPLDPDEERARVVPVIEAIRREFPHVPISIDTYKADVARAALDAGATIVNDVSGLTSDSPFPGGERGSSMTRLVAERGCPIVIMHILGRPRDIPSKPEYADVVQSIVKFFRRQVDYARREGVAEGNIILDPGIGFGKTSSHNLEILRRLREIVDLGYPVLVGASRKRFLGKILGVDDPLDRVEGTAATVALSIAAGASIVRVHDVRQMARVAKVSDAIVRGWKEDE